MERLRKTQMKNETKKIIAQELYCFFKWLLIGVIGWFGILLIITLIAELGNDSDLQNLEKGIANCWYLLIPLPLTIFYVRRSKKWIYKWKEYSISQNDDESVNSDESQV